MADQMIDQALATDGSWTLIAEGPIANILLAAGSSGWEIYIGPNQPTPETSGLPISAFDGSFSASALDEGSNVYARSFGRLAGATMSLRGVYN